MSGQIDKEWFMEKLHDQKKSLRGLARYMEMDPSSLSRMLSGERRMRMEEAAAIARFLGAPVSEVLQHAGVAIDLDGQPTRIILAAIITENGAIERLKEPRPLPPGFIERAQAAIRTHGNGRVVAAQVRAATGPLALWDDVVILFGHTDAVEHDAIGQLSVCRLHEGDQILAKITRARKTGEAWIMTVGGGEREVMLQTATPVLAVIP